jgi:ribosome-binding protein aMBF1 (putative translation factor)
MATQKPTPAPKGFRDLIKSAMEKEGLNITELAQRANLSQAFISRILNGERGAPTDQIILKLEKILRLKTKQLLYEAGRLGLEKEGLPLLMRTLGPLSPEDVQKVQKLADKLAAKYHPEPQ